MGIETATKIADLNTAWPLGTDPKSEGDNHLRVIKTAVKNQFGSGDMWFGQKTSPDKWVWNDKADNSGNDVMTLTRTGGLFVQGNSGTGISNRFGNSGGDLTLSLGASAAGNNILFTSADYNTIRGGVQKHNVNDTVQITNRNSAGTVLNTLSLNQDGSISASGDLTATGNVTAGSSHVISGWFQTPSTDVILAGGGGTLYLRPTGPSAPGGQTTLSAAGVMTVNGNFTSTTQVVAGAPVSTSGAANGITITAGSVQSSRNIGTTSTHYFFYNTNAQVGSITTNGSATQFVTSSDERLKEFGAEMTLEEAFAVIEADPVRHFTWRTDGQAAVGWSAQKSWAVSHDLASPPEAEFMKTEPGDEDFQPWGMDQSRRTPYLWAACRGLMEKIAALEARIAMLETG